MEKLEISLDSELVNRMDKIVELLAFNNKKELICYVIRRYVDKYHSQHIKITDRDP